MHALVHPWTLGFMYLPEGVMVAPPRDPVPPGWVGATMTAGSDAKLVVKVVRELGQPALAKAFADAQTKKAESGKQAEEDQRQTWTGPTAGWDTLSGFRSDFPATRDSCH